MKTFFIRDEGLLHGPRYGLFRAFMDNVLHMRWILLHGTLHGLFYIWIEMGWIIDQSDVVTRF